MQQAARSGKQNISEGYSRAGTSADTAILLINEKSRERKMLSTFYLFLQLIVNKIQKDSVIL